jgi:hypothetical protein
VASSDDLDNSMGLSAAERAYIRYIEREGLGRGGGGGRRTWRERTPQRRRRRAATAVRAVAEVATTTAALAVTPVARRHRHK